jgi:SPP1 gp7 family putative phage head morphogenesis protein
MSRKGTVTADQRKRADRAATDKNKLTRIGLKAVQRIGFRAQKAAYAAQRRGQSPGMAAGKIIRTELSPILVDAMRAAHVGGLRRTLINTPKPVMLSLAGDPFGEAIEAMRKRAAVNDTQMEALAETYTPQVSKVVETFEAHVNRKLIRVSTELLSEGVHIREAKVRLAHAFDELGMTPNNSFTLEGIFRTEMAKAYSAGSYAAEQDPAIQEILWGYKYVTVGDGRVRDTHVGFDGVTLPKDDPFWDVNRPPCGFACRCECIPLFDKYKEAKPVSVDVDGKQVTPEADSGFGVNFGRVLKSPSPVRNPTAPPHPHARPKSPPPIQSQSPAKSPINPPAERLRDRIEGTQAEADREVKKYQKQVDKLETKISDVIREKDDAVSVLKKKHEAVMEKIKDLDKMKAESDRRIADLKSQLARSKKRLR